MAKSRDSGSRGTSLLALTLSVTKTFVKGGDAELRAQACVRGKRSIACLEIEVN